MNDEQKILPYSLCECEFLKLAWRINTDREKETTVPEQANIAKVNLVKKKQKVVLPQDMEIVL